MKRQFGHVISSLHATEDLEMRSSTQRNRRVCVVVCVCIVWFQRPSLNCPPKLIINKALFPWQRNVDAVGPKLIWQLSASIASKVNYWERPNKSQFICPVIHSFSQPTYEPSKQTNWPQMNAQYLILIFHQDIGICRWSYSSCLLHLDYSNRHLISEQLSYLWDSSCIWTTFCTWQSLVGGKKRNWNYRWKYYEYGTKMGGKYLLVSSECKYCNGQSPCWLQIVLQTYKANKVFRVAQSNWKQTITFPVYLLSANN